MRATILGLTAALVSFGCDGSPAVEPRHDASAEIETVFLISIDSLRADRLGAYGHSAPTSPTLDRLASEGLLFERAYSTTSWTLPSHAAMLTGLDDYEHGAYEALRPISDGVMTLAERLSKADIKSTGFFSGPFLHPTYGFSRGFDRYIDATSYGWKNSGKPNIDIPHDASHKDVTNPIVLRKVKAWLEDQPDRAVDSRDGPRRSFVFIHLWDVHYDYIPPPEYVEIFDPDYTGNLTGEDFLTNPLIRPDMPKRDLQHLLALYDGEIRYTDDTIARILDLFDEHGMLEKSAVIVTADHGEEFFDHGLKGHGLTLHDEVIRVPLILWLPDRNPARSKSNRITSHIDITPTVCALLAVDCDYHGIGDSLLPDYLEETPPARRGDALVELSNPFLKADLTARIDADGKMLSENRSRLLFYSPTSRPGKHEKTVKLSETTLAQAPENIRNAAIKLRERTAEAKELGAKILRDVSPDEKPIDSKTLEQLKALGYLSADHVSDAERDEDATAPSTPPNIVLILSDDQAWSDFGFTGSGIAKTPNIDALAAQGIRFSLAFNTGNRCRPSVRSILTGYHPQQFVARVAALRQSGDSRSIPPFIRHIETLPRLLADQGYVSFQGGKYWDGSYQNGGFTVGLSEGFGGPESSKNKKRPVHPIASEESGPGRFRKNPALILAGGAGLELGRSTMEPLFRFIAENHDHPFFVWFAPMLPHIPFDASKRDRAPYEQAGLSEPAIGYYANIARLDRRVGELVDYLRENDQIENTLIVFLTDNGWEVGAPGNVQQAQEGGPRGKASLYEKAFRTPLIFSWPSRITPRRDDQHLVSTVDLFATLLDFGEIASPPDRWGESLKPLLLGTGSFSRKKVMGEVDQLRTEPGGKFPFVEMTEGFFMRTEDWRYVRVPGRRIEALYSMKDDPEETKNVCGKNREVCTRMRHELEKWTAEAHIIPPTAKRND